MLFRPFFDVSSMLFFYFLSFYILPFLYFCFSMFCRSMFRHRSVFSDIGCFGVVWGVSTDRQLIRISLLKNGGKLKKCQQSSLDL